VNIVIFLLYSSWGNKWTCSFFTYVFCL